MVNSEANTGKNMPVGHRRKLAEPSRPQEVLDTAAPVVVKRTVGTRRRPDASAPTGPLLAPTFSHAVPGSRRKIESLDSGSAFPAAIAAQIQRPVGSRRRTESSAAPVASVARSAAANESVATAAFETIKTSSKANAKSASQNLVRTREDRAQINPFLRKRLVPAVGFSALALASVAAFIDVSSLPSTGQYKDVITAAAVTSQASVATSRDLERAPVVDSASARAEVEGSRFVTRKIDVLADASKDSATLASLSKGQTVRITGVTEGVWSQVIHKDLPRWVESAALSSDKPPLLAHEGEISAAVCSRGSSIEARLQPDTIRVYRAVCERFPEIRQYWGQANRGTHSTGHSLDIMVSGGRGKEVAAFLQDRKAELGIEYLIYQQKIWSVERSAAGWRSMADRGGITANHYDHVHVTTYGSAAK